MEGNPAELPSALPGREVSPVNPPGRIQADLIMTGRLLRPAHESGVQRITNGLAIGPRAVLIQVVLLRV